MESAANNLKQLATARVLVIGDVMLDRYWMGDVDRISPEAPVPIVSVKRTEERIGGAGNVARNITALGGSCSLMGIVGDDMAGKRIADIAGNSGVDLQLEEQSDYETVVKLRILSKNQQLIRADFESIPDKSTLNQMQSRFEQLVNGFDIVIFSDYGKGTLYGIQTLIGIARDAGKPVLVDPKGTDFERYYGATMMTPNLAEFQAVAGPVSDEESLTSKAQKMVLRFGFENLLVTLSEKGMTLFQSGNQPIHVESRHQEVFDVSGAGDTVIAVMAMALGSKLDATTSIEIANAAAGAVISKLGTATTSQSELLEILTTARSAGVPE
jgi:rfaE bifunctional protein kinase chain/domain